MMIVCAMYRIPRLFLVQYGR